MGTHTTGDGAGRARVVAVGVSRFADPDVRPLPFATADAQAFGGAFSGRAAARTLTDGEATAGGVRDVLLGLSAAGPDDAVYAFLVSHATDEGGEVLLHAFDGPVALRDALGPVWDGPARRVVLLLDLVRGGTAGSPTAALIASLFPPREGRSLVLADDGRHGSYISGELQSGVWAAHVAAAFSGGAARAREADGTLTAGSLRAYLADEVSRSLARAYTDGRRQSPVVLAASDDEVFAEAIAAEEPVSSQKPALGGVRFFSEREVPVKALGGFRKGVHSPPTDTLASSREWVARLAEPDLAKELEETVARLRRHLGYKRRDLRADGPAGGAASVLTPDFAYHLTARQHADRGDRAVFRRTLAEVRSADVLSSPSFAEAFPQGFLSLYCPFETPADIEALVDAIEDAEPDGLARLDYPTDLSYCELELAGFDGRVRIERGGVTVSGAGPAPPGVLAGRFAAVKRVLAGAGL